MSCAELHTAGPAPQRLDARDAALLALLAVAFLGSRLAWLVASPETSTYWEEAYRWTAAREILSGPVQPLLEYQADHYQGGPLVVILLALPLFALLGDSLLGLKAIALLFASATLVALYALGRVWFGRTTAVLAGLAYLAGPPLLAFSALVTMGSHGESALFSLLQLLLFFGLVSGHWRTARTWALFGLVSGLGLWFCYTSALSLAACALSWPLLARAPRTRELAAAAAGALLGLLPWLAYNLAYDFAGVGRLLELVGLGDPIDTWVEQGAGRKLRELLARHLPFGLVFPFGVALPRPLAAALLAGVLLPLAAALAAATWRAGRLVAGALRARARPGDAAAARELPFVVYGLLFLAAFLASDFTVDVGQRAHAYRLFLPPAVLALFLASATAARALSAGGGLRSAALVGCALHLAASAAGTALVATRSEHHQQVTIGAGYVVRGMLLHRKYERELERALAAVRRIPDPQLRYHAFQGIGWGLEFRFEKRGTPKAVRNELLSLRLAERAPVLSGMMWSLHRRLGDAEEAIARGEDGAFQAALRQRLRDLEAMAQREWERIPAPLRRFEWLEE